MNRWRRRLGGWAVWAAASAAGAHPARAQEAEGPRITTSALELAIGGRLQIQANTTTAGTEPTTDFIFRRVRLDVRARVTELVGGRIQPEFAGERVRLTDAYVTLGFSPAAQLLVGRTYRPFSRLELTSDNLTPPVERGATIRGVDALDEYELVSGLSYSDRDLGVQLLGAPEWAPLGFEYTVGIFGGPLLGETGNRDTYQLAARATVQPLAGIEIGAGWSRRDFARPPGADGAVELTAGSAFEVDLEYGGFDPGWHLIAEVASGALDPFAGADFTGAQGWLAYRTERLDDAVLALEPTLRLSHGDPDAVPGGPPSPGGTLLTPGINVYFTPITRFLLNYDVWLPRGDGERAGSLKAQMQMAF